jgi:regulator of replication initiation timing
MAQALPLPEPTADNGLPGIRGAVPRRSDLDMRASKEMLAMEQQLRNYEEELTRLRVENEQLRRSSQAFGELAERLSVALQTATRVNRRTSTAADNSRLRVLAES